MNEHIRHIHEYIQVKYANTIHGRSACTGGCRSFNQCGSYRTVVVLRHIVLHLILCDPHIVNQLLLVQVDLTASVLGLQEEHLNTEGEVDGKEGEVDGKEEEVDSREEEVDGREEEVDGREGGRLIPRLMRSCYNVPWFRQCQGQRSNCVGRSGMQREHWRGSLPLAWSHTPQLALVWQPASRAEGDS